MHELSIAQSIVETVTGQLPQDKVYSVDKVFINVGKLSGVYTDSLLFCYPLVIETSMLSNSSLVINEIPIRYLCQSCKSDFTAETPTYICSNCESDNIIMTEGTELNISNIEVTYV